MQKCMLGKLFYHNLLMEYFPLAGNGRQISDHSVALGETLEGANYKMVSAW